MTYDRRPTAWLKPASSATTVGHSHLLPAAAPCCPLLPPAAPCCPLLPPAAGQCDWFIDVTWVCANGTVHVSKRGSPEAEALCGGLGLLGVISEFNLQLTPTSNTRFSTWYLRDDANLAADVEEMLKVRPSWQRRTGRRAGRWAALTWHPGQPAPTSTDLCDVRHAFTTSALLAAGWESTELACLAAAP